MMLRQLSLCLASASVLAACAAPPAAMAEPADELSSLKLVPKEGGMPGFFDCLRQEEAVIISAHRGGPVPGYPENALETFEHTVSQIPALLEIDVQRSSDGVFILMHDDTLDRTTNGEGAVAEKSFAELQELRLVDNDGLQTDFSIPTLKQALKWADGKTLLALDRKDPISYADMIEVAEEMEAIDRVLIATYSLEDAIMVAALSPKAMIVTPVESLEDLRVLEAGGVDLSHILSWTGTEVPRPELYERLAGEGVESAFATLGYWTGSWDNRILMLEDDTLYRRITRGVQLVATDRAFDVSRILPGVPKVAACTAP